MYTEFAGLYFMISLQVSNNNLDIRWFLSNEDELGLKVWTVSKLVSFIF